MQWWQGYDFMQDYSQSSPIPIWPRCVGEATVGNVNSEFVKVTYLSGLRQAHITVDLMAMPCR